MLTFYFFYNIIIMIAYGACAIIFFSFYFKNKKRIYVSVGLLFVFYALSNLFYYMKEFLPAFNALYESTFPVSVCVMSLIEVIGMYLSVAVMKILYGENISGSYMLLWAVLCIAACFVPYTFICVMILVNISFVGIGIKTICRKEYGSVYVPLPALFIIIICYIVILIQNIAMLFAYGNSTYEIGFSYNLISRSVFVEISGITVTYCALKYIIRKSFDKSQKIELNNIQEDNLIEKFEKHGLTEREIEVGKLLYEGLSNAEISERLFVSTGTVKVHVHHIYEKFGVNSRYHLMSMLLDIKGSDNDTDKPEP